MSAELQTVSAEAEHEIPEAIEEECNLDSKEQNETKYAKPSHNVDQDKRDLERVIAEFAAAAPAQARIKRVLENAGRYLTLVENGKQGRGYRATSRVPAGVDLAVYMGTLHAVDKAPYSDHAMVIGEIGLEHECLLLIDGTLRADSSDYRLGQLQLVNHGCAGTHGCNTVCEWVSYGELGMYVLTSSREIAEGEDIAFQYHPKRPPRESTHADFWRDNRDAPHPPSAGYKIVRCLCSTLCPNGFWRYERKRRRGVAPPPPPAPTPVRVPAAPPPPPPIHPDSDPSSLTFPSLFHPSSQPTPLIAAPPVHPPVHPVTASLATHSASLGLPLPPHLTHPHIQSSPSVPSSPCPPQPLSQTSPLSQLQVEDTLPSHLHMLTTASVVTMNVGPIGLAASLVELARILATRPVAVLLQEAHVPYHQMQEVRSRIHQVSPAYCVFASRKARVNGKIDIITLVHVNMTARASLLDISVQFREIADDAPEALARVHFVRITDTDGQVSVLLGNVHQYDARESRRQAAVLTLIQSVVARWGAEIHHVVIGGDLNASLHARQGYAEGSATAAADTRLAVWARESGLSYLAPDRYSWTDARGSRRATLDAFLVRDKQSLGNIVCIESSDPRHDHLGLQAAIVDDRLRPMPDLESLRRPVRLKLEGLRDVGTRREYTRLAQEAAIRVQASRGAAGIFPYLDEMKSAVLAVAKATLGTRGGEIRPSIPRHSDAFRRAAARIRLLRVVRREILDRRGFARGDGIRPASKAMIKLWHSSPEAFPEGTAFRTLGNLAGGDAGWSRLAVAGLRAHIHTAEEELRQLRRSELKEATERRRQAAIDNFWSGGGLRWFLHPPSPSLHSAVMRGQVVTAVTIHGTEPALDCIQQGSTFDISRVDSGGLVASLQSSTQLSPLLQAAERVGARVTAFDTKTALVTDRRERIALWEQWLGEAAGATKQRCKYCRSQTLRRVPGLMGTGSWWCCACSRIVDPVIEVLDYADVPFPTAGIARIPAGTTLRGPVAREDLDYQLARLSNRSAPGPDELPNELLKTAPREFRQALLDSLNEILENGTSPPTDWLGGLVRFLPKPGGDPLAPGGYRPVCLQNTVYKLLSAVVNDRLYRLCERHGLLDPSQEGFRRLRCTQRQVQSLHWIIEAAAQSRAALYLIYIDFENAFNSVDHAAVWRWLAELNVPDIDLLRSLYEGAHYEADLPYGRSSPVFLTRGTKQGDILSPLLFNLVFNALLIGLRQSGVGFSTVRGLRTPGRGFADDLTLSTATPAGMKKLLDVVARFCTWTGMRVKLTKSVITAYDFAQRADLPTDGILYQGEALTCLPANESFRYLGVRTSLTVGRKRKTGQGPGTADEIQHVFSSTKELKPLLFSHQMPLPLMVPSMRMVAASRFRYSAALVPWTDAQLEELFKVWMQVERAAWKLQGSFPSAQFRLPPDSAGTPLEHPRVVLIQALSTHVRQLVALADDLRESTISRYRQLCLSCGCLNERELARHLASETQPRRCPIARLLRACGQLGIDIKLPDCLTAGKAMREVSWYALREHVRARVAPEDELGNRDLACVVLHWPAILRRLRGRGIHFPRQLLLDRNEEPATWLLPPQMSRNPGWLSPLRRLLERVQARSLFPRLDRGQGVQEIPAHQALVSQLLGALHNTHAAQELQEIFADVRWTAVRSSAPVLSWIHALQQEGLSTIPEVTTPRSRAIVDMFRNLGMRSHNLPSLQRLCLRLAPTLYTVTQGDSERQADNIFTETAPLSREYVSFSTDAGERDCMATHIGPHTLVTKNGVTRVEAVTGQHIGTVNQGRWNLLATRYDTGYMIRALPQWIAQISEEERSRGVPSLQLWLGVCRAFHGDVIVGCCPLVAPACFRSALCGRKGEGWGHQEAKTKPVYNLLCMTDREINVILNRLAYDKPWLALTRNTTLSAEAEQLLTQVGTRLFVWRRGSVVAASTGNWRKAQVRSVQSKEDWTLWSSTLSAETEGPQLKFALQNIVLTRDGTIPLETASPLFREAQLGPAGWALTYPGIVVATDGAVKEDGRMGCAYVSLDDNVMPPRAFVVLGPPSAMRAELSGLDQAVADAPLDQDLTILTDSLASMQKLEALQRKDFPEWLHCHPERALLESVVARINVRAKARVLTRVVKVPAHKAHPLNEAADAAASQAALEADIGGVLSHSDSGAVRFYLSGRLTEWGTNVRQHLIQVAARQHKDRLSLLLSQQMDSEDADMASTSAQARRNPVSLTARWIMRSDLGREYLGAAMAAMRNGAQKRRLFQTVAGMFPCRALLFKQGKSPSPQCLLCGGQSETVAHIQCWCPSLREARIAAHHAIAALIFHTLQRHSIGRWQLLVEIPVSSLRAAEVPLDMYDPWNRMIDDIEESELEADGLGRQQVLARLRPDAWAISWSSRQILLLELTRAHDWNEGWSRATDESKRGRYARLRERMQDLLPTGWSVETVPLTVGIRGSLQVSTWVRLLERFGINTRATQVRFLQDLTWQVLEELDKLYGVRSAALQQTQHARGN